MNPYLTVAEVASLEGVSDRRIRKLCEQDRIFYAHKFNNQWMIQREYRIIEAKDRRQKRLPVWVKLQFQSASSKK